MFSDSIQLEKGSVSPRLGLELAQEGISKQLELIALIDSKLSMVIGFSTATVTVFGGLLAVARRDVPLSSVWLLVAAGSIYLVLMLVAILALRPRTWLFTPDLHTSSALPKRTDDMLEAEMAWATNEFDKMFRSNLRIQKNKATLLAFAFFLLVLEASLLVASSVFFLLESDSQLSATGGAPVLSSLAPFGPVLSLGLV